MSISFQPGAMPDVSAALLACDTFRPGIALQKSGVRVPQRHCICGELDAALTHFDHPAGR